MAHTLFTCSNCGSVKSKDGDACPVCGSLRQDVTWPVSTGGFNAELNAPRVSAKQVDFARNRDRVVLKTPTGSSTATRAKDEITIEAEGRPQIGEPGQPWVLDTFLKRLRQDGLAPRELTGSQNDRGEDAKIELEDRSYVVQMTSVSPGPVFWGDVSRGSGSVSADNTQVVAWIREAIERKKGMSDKGGVILLLDITHLSILGDPRFVEPYLSRYGDPSEEFGWASVWLVGVDADTTIRLSSPSNLSAP